MLRHPSRDTFSYFETDALERIGGITYSNGKIELVLLLVDHQQ